MPIRRILIWLAVALGVVVGVAVLGVATVVALSRARDRQLTEALVPFYTPPDPLPPGQPGDLLRQEALDAPDGVRVWRVLYRSTTFQNQPAVVSGLIAVPDRAPPPGGFPVVAVAHGTIGTARICAPSLAPFTSKSMLPSFLSPSQNSETFYDLLVKPFNDAGYAVAASDYRGLGTPGPSPYLIGEDEARNVLDSARAIRHIEGFSLSDQTFIWGQSQGGHSAAFAAQIMSRYAPELRVPGVVIGAPAVQLEQLAVGLSAIEGRSPLTALFMTIVRAWTGNYSDLAPETVLTARGVRNLKLVDERCIGDLLLTFGFRDADNFINGAGIRLPEWQQHLTENTPASVRYPAPVHVFQGLSDQIIAPETTTAFVRRMCGAGNTLQYQTYPGLGHISAILPSMSDTLAWMADRLAGKPAPSTC